MLDVKRWLARLSWSFLIVAGVLLWQANQVRRTAAPDSGTMRIALYVLGAACAAALGAAGIKARHRRD